MKKKIITVTSIAFIVFIFLIIINIGFVTDVYDKKDYIYTSTAIGSSMYPYIKNGDTILVLVKDSPCFTISVGDVVVYTRSDIGAIAHRVYEVEDGRYYAKGDNNPMVDTMWIDQDHIIGKVYGVIDQNNILQKIIVEQFIN